MKFSVVICLAAVVVCARSSNADLITTFDFRDAMWDVQVSETTTGILTTTAGVRFNGNALSAERLGGVAGAVLVTARLISAISTVGFQNIALEFANEGTGMMEYDGVIFGTGTGDGFEISSTAGVGFSTRNASLPFETALDDEQTWTATDATTFGQDLTFLSSANNGSISDLEIQLQVNSSLEVLRLETFRLTGDVFVATVATPEPGSCALLLLVTLGFAIRTRQRCQR